MAEATQETVAAFAQPALAAYCHVGPEGFTFDLKVTGSAVAIAGVGAALGAGLTLYLSNRTFAQNIRKAAARALGAERNDRDVGDIRDGSLLVELHCYTAKSFLDFLEDYESGKAKERLQEELSNAGIKVEELSLEVRNINEANEHKQKLLSMAGNRNFVRPNWLPDDIIIPGNLYSYRRVKDWVAPQCHEKERIIMERLNLRIRIEQRPESQITMRDVIVSNIMEVGISAGVGFGLLGGFAGMAIGAAGGALVGFVGYLSLRKLIEPEERRYQVQLDEYTDQPANKIERDCSLNLRDEVMRRDIEHHRPPAPIHELYTAAKLCYYFRRLRRYCHINMGLRNDPNENDHRLAAEAAHGIARNCGPMPPFEYP